MIKRDGEFESEISGRANDDQKKKRKAVGLRGNDARRGKRPRSMSLRIMADPIGGFLESKSLFNMNYRLYNSWNTNSSTVRVW